ncbi:DUF5655 domain-containing protein [Georgenia muralis]|uniref:DUF5655 domain-containing protein n=1 Tax=Georgenia muralis TaxID=154117 RepID=A0A3N4Z013_9MICO|nr:DUF5655 domain-containing protein [Georgenia muralis]RPF26679.1 hypothetical protein EDD32_1127 [Georgenia muralis]
MSHGSPGVPADPRTPEEFFAGSATGQAIHDAVAAVVAGLGPHEVRVSRSQVAFRRRRGFAYLWRPERYLRSDVPAVLSVALPEPWDSPRFKESVRLAHLWMHHLEVLSAAEIDDEVRGWLRAAYDAAG